MSKKLNELLDDLKKWVDSPLDEIDMNYGIWELNVNESKELLDYINSLQQENQQLKQQLQNINDEFLKYDWENSNSNQLKNQIKSLYEAIKGDKNE